MGSGAPAFCGQRIREETLRIAVDLPLRVDGLKLQGVCDGKTWNAEEVKASDGGFVSCWVSGLPENCDRANVAVYLGETKLRVQYVGEPDAEGMRQINAALAADTGKGAAVVPGGVRRREHGGTGAERGLDHVQIKKDQPGPGNHHGLMSSVAIGLIVFACVFGGALLGIFLRGVLPPHHLSAGSKDIVRLGMGLVGTMAALVLGLLVASAKNSYDSQSNELTQLSANVVFLDRLLAHYGPEARGARDQLRASGCAHRRAGVA